MHTDGTGATAPAPLARVGLSTVAVNGRAGLGPSVRIGGSIPLPCRLPHCPARQPRHDRSLQSWGTSFGCRRGTSFGCRLTMPGHATPPPAPPGIGPECGPRCMRSLQLSGTGMPEGSGGAARSRCKGCRPPAHAGRRKRPFCCMRSLLLSGTLMLPPLWVEGLNRDRAAITYREYLPRQRFSPSSLIGRLGRLPAGRVAPSVSAGVRSVR